MSKIVYFSPHYPWPPRHGAHSRILQTIALMASTGAKIDFVYGKSSNDNAVTLSPPSCINSVSAISLGKPILTKIRNFVRIRPTLDYSSDSGVRDFHNIIREKKPRLVFMNYAHWCKLIPDDRDFPVIVDSHDSLAKKQFLEKAARIYINNKNHINEPFQPYADEYRASTNQLHVSESSLLSRADLVISISKSDHKDLATFLPASRLCLLRFFPPDPSRFVVKRSSGNSPRGKYAILPLGPNYFNYAGMVALQDSLQGRTSNTGLIAITGTLRHRFDFNSLHHHAKYFGRVGYYQELLSNAQFGIAIPFTGTGAQIKQYEFALSGLPVLGYRDRLDPDLFTDGINSLMSSSPAQLCKSIFNMFENEELSASIRLEAAELPAQLINIHAIDQDNIFSALQLLSN